MYLFILCPPRQGSTILYKLLSTSPHVTTLLGPSAWAGEGQFVPGAAGCFTHGRWNPQVNWKCLKRLWDKHWDLAKPIKCEKSPCNICRGLEMEKFFSKFGDVYFVCMVRSPYSRDNMHRWIKGAEYQRRNMVGLKNVLRLTYEDLTGHTVDTVSRLLEFVPGLERLDAGVSGVRGIGDPKRNGPIRNMNKKNSPAEIRAKNKVLRHHVDLLKFHGYELKHG